MEGGEATVEQLYTHGVWIVKPGLEDEFVRRWQDLASWTLSAFPSARGTLLQDSDDPRRFHSFGPWESQEQIEAWRGSQGFQDRVGKLRETLEHFEPRTMRLIFDSGAR
jgi:heme-degrading monooxygenase HmoA